MGYTLADGYFRVDVNDRSSLYCRVSGCVKQFVATGDEAESVLTQVWGQPHNQDEKGYQHWEIGT